jgi:hypothetical protein
MENPLQDGNVDGIIGYYYNCKNCHKPAIEIKGGQFFNAVHVDTATTCKFKHLYAGDVFERQHNE